MVLIARTLTTIAILITIIIAISIIIVVAVWIKIYLIIPICLEEFRRETITNLSGNFKEFEKLWNFKLNFII